MFPSYIPSFPSYISSSSCARPVPSNDSERRAMGGTIGHACAVPGSAGFVGLLRCSENDRYARVVHRLTYFLYKDPCDEQNFFGCENSYSIAEQIIVI